MNDKTDYSPVAQATGEAEKRRERRMREAFFVRAHAFWISALVLAGINLLVVWLA